MKELTKIIGYFVAVILLGCVLAPLLYKGAHAIEPWAIANNLLNFGPPLGETGPDTTPSGPPTASEETVVSGPLAFLESDFQKFFNRAMLLAALLLLWPALRLLNMSRADLRLHPDLRRGSHLGLGLAIGGGLVAAMAASYVFLGFYHLKPKPPWGDLYKIAISAAVVAAVEEALFRGAIYGLFARALKPRAALFWTTLIFASVHFLKPEEAGGIWETVKERMGGSLVHWYSGFTLLPHVFHQFGEPLMLLAGFTTLFVLGWLLGYARQRTDALWLSIGLHAGVVFVKMGFAKITKRDSDSMPWIGPELQIGLVPVALLLLGLIIVWRRMEYEDLLPTPRKR